MNSKLWFVLGAASICAAQATACSSDFSSCTDSRTCIAGGADGEGEAGQKRAVVRRARAMAEREKLRAMMVAAAKAA